MKWLCYEKGILKRLWNKEEKKDAYCYWKNRKPVFVGDSIISIFLREGEEGAFEALMQNGDIKQWESYGDYVQEYQWVAESEFSIAQWTEEGIYGDEGTDSTKKNFWTKDAI